MIPKLDSPNELQECYQHFTKQLAKTSYQGEIRTSYADRLVMATDNSIYQILPQAVLFPRNQQDVVEIMRLLQREEFRGIKVSPRGGGTGTNGQSLNNGIVLDLSKFMNRILELNLEEGWVRVEPGVVRDQLNQYLAPYGRFFAPTLSTSNRATLGGMINTDASGKGSRIYGKTSNHVLELEAVLVDGSTLKTRELTIDELALVEQSKSREGDIHREINDLVTRNRALIETRIPKLQRFLTGYNLEKIYSEDRQRFSLNYLLAGSEGTLAVITEAKLRITPDVKYKKLVLVKYGSFNEALEDAQVLVGMDPAAIETIDERILALAKEDEIYHRVKDMITDEARGVTRAINLVEFVSDSQEVVREKVEALCHIIQDPDNTASPAIGFFATEKDSEIESCWELRKKGVGLLGNTKGARKPIAFVEDTAVPPQHLAAYIREFRALLDQHGLTYGMFGHVDVGCLHVRPALDMKNPEDEKLLYHISNEVAALVQKYGGVMWGEHGKGFRSEYGPQFFGTELFGELRRIKQLFDPENRLNPGKIVTPLDSPEQLVMVASPTRGQQDRQIPEAIRDAFTKSIDCNGNGACFNYNPDDLMCPSMRVTRDRVQSPKGRAGIMREWLRLLTGTGYNPLNEKFPADDTAFAEISLNHAKPTRDDNGEYDFSHEVFEAFAGCLACKACATQCPIKVDVPELRSRFFQLYYTRYRRPLRDYLTAKLEESLHLQATAPRITNLLSGLSLTKSVMSKQVGIVDLPQLSAYSVAQGLRVRKAPLWNLQAMSGLSAEEKSRSVILVQDAFTTYYESDLFLSIYDTLKGLGIQPYVMPFFENGKAYHVKGFLEKFKRVAWKNAVRLSRAADTGIALVGIDPAVVLTYRDEYLHTLGESHVRFRVQLIQEWLSEVLKRDPSLVQRFLQRFGRPSPEAVYRLFGHCTEKAAAPNSQKQWQTIFRTLGFDLVLEKVGCCGMCGVYGHEADHVEDSKAIYKMSWSHKVDGEILVTGYSCRSQVKRMEQFKPHHPMQILLRHMVHNL